MAIVYKAFNYDGDLFFVSFNAGVKPEEIKKFLDGVEIPTEKQVSLLKFEGKSLSDIPEEYQSSYEDWLSLQYIRGTNLGRYIKDVIPSKVLKPVEIVKDVIQRDIGNWLMSNGVPLCVSGVKFNPKFIEVEDGFFYYNYERTVYITLEGYSRHRPAKESQTFVIDLKKNKSTYGIERYENGNHIVYKSKFNHKYRLWDCLKYDVEGGIISVKRD